MPNYKYYNQDEVRERGSIAIPLPMNNEVRNRNSKIFELTTTTEDQAVSNYINLLLTKPGERFMQPSFGIGLQLYIFENDGRLGLEQEISDVIETESSIWLPYIINENIRVTMEDNSIYITIEFRVGETGANRTITLIGDVNSQELQLQTG